MSDQASPLDLSSDIKLRAIEGALAVVAMAAPEHRLEVFQTTAHVAAFYCWPVVDRQRVIDALHEAALQSGLYERHGVAAVQCILADAFVRRDRSIAAPIARECTSDIGELAA